MTDIPDGVVERVAIALEKAMLAHGTNDNTCIAPEDAPTLARAALEAAKWGEMVQFARNVAEGNLGDAPWQANYERLKELARALLSSIGATKGDTV
jgi:hypothetical protein